MVLLQVKGVYIACSIPLLTILGLMSRAQEPVESGIAVTLVRRTPYFLGKAAFLRVDVMFLLQTKICRRASLLKHSSTEEARLDHAFLEL